METTSTAAPVRTTSSAAGEEPARPEPRWPAAGYVLAWQPGEDQEEPGAPGCWVWCWQPLLYTALGPGAARRYGAPVLLAPADVEPAVLEAWALLLLHTEHPGVRIAAMNPVRHPGLGSEHRAWRVLPAARRRVLGTGGRANFADTQPGEGRDPGA